MFDEKDTNEEVKAEETVTEEKAEEPKEEKKENAFKRFWNKTKQSVNEAVLESKIRSAYEKAHKSYTVYTKNELLPKNYAGEIKDGVLTVFGEEQIKPYAVVIANDEEEKAFYAVSTEATAVTVAVEGVNYERPATAVTLDENVEEVNVVKAGKRYFIYKGSDKAE